jgi:ribosome maturation factor RimP
LSSQPVFLPQANAQPQEAGQELPTRLGSKALIERCVLELGFDFVDLEMPSHGVMRVVIDVQGNEQHSGAPERFVTVQDCEKVSHQLSHELLVEGIEYDRLEVSSPGLDRPLKKPQDFVRFAGLPVVVKLRTAVAGRRQFEGVLSVLEPNKFAVTYEVNPVGVQPRSPSRRTTRQKAPALAQVSFVFSDVERARLVPQVQF